MNDVDTCGERDPMNIKTIHNQEMHECGERIPNEHHHPLIKTNTLKKLGLKEKYHPCND
jgi:hypothetical protein